MLALLMAGFEMFCERCGTRYEYGAPSGGGLSRRVLDAVGLRSAADGALPMLTLCLSCRGYTCDACWNGEAALCKTCAPVPEEVIPVAPVEQPSPPPALAFGAPLGASVDFEPAIPPAPAADLAPAFQAPPASSAAAETPLPAEPHFAPLVEPEPVVYAEPEPVGELTVPGEPIHAGQTEFVTESAAPFAAEPELVEAVVEPEPQPEFVAEPQPELEPVAVAEEPEPEFVAEPEPEPEPVAVAEEPEPRVRRRTRTTARSRVRCSA